MSNIAVVPNDAVVLIGSRPHRPMRGHMRACTYCRVQHPVPSVLVVG